MSAATAKPESKARTLTIAQWNEEGVRRFGEDRFKWKFKCPACGHVQAVEDFRPYKDRGATADTARFNCIGRYSAAPRKAFGESGKGPCDYTSGGLFDLRPITVVLENGENIRSFEFAEESEVLQ